MPDAQISAQIPSTTQPSADTLYETMLAGLLDFMFGKGLPDIQRQLHAATPDTLATVIGHITYALVQQGAEQGENRGYQFDFDTLFGVATQIIEALEKLAAAGGHDVEPEAVSLQALVTALNDYAQSLPEGGHAQADAKQALKSITPQEWQGAHDTIAQIGAAHGINPFAQTAQTQPQSAQTPQAAAPQGGLMGGAA